MGGSGGQSAATGTCTERLPSMALPKSSSQHPQGRAVSPRSQMKKLSLTGVESLVPRHRGRKRQSCGLGPGPAAVSTQAYPGALLRIWLGREEEHRKEIERITNEPGDVGTVTQVLQMRRLRWLRSGESSDSERTASKCHGWIPRTLGCLAGEGAERGGAGRQRSPGFPLLGLDSHRS